MAKSPPTQGSTPQRRTVDDKSSSFQKQATLSELCYVVYEIEKDGAKMLVRKIGQSEIAIAVTGRDIKLCRQ
jgi:hypothetical protein